MHAYETYLCMLYNSNIQQLKQMLFEFSGHRMSSDFFHLHPVTSKKCTGRSSAVG